MKIIRTPKSSNLCLAQYKRYIRAKPKVRAVGCPDTFVLCYIESINFNPWYLCQFLTRRPGSRIEWCVRARRWVLWSRDDMRLGGWESPFFLSSRSEIFTRLYTHKFSIIFSSRAETGPQSTQYRVGLILLQQPKEPGIEATSTLLVCAFDGLPIEQDGG